MNRQREIRGPEDAAEILQMHSLSKMTIFEVMTMFGECLIMAMDAQDDFRAVPFTDKRFSDIEMLAHKWRALAENLSGEREQ